MKVTNSKLKDVRVIHPSPAFEDHRGKYLQTYDRSFLDRNGIDLDFVQEDVVLSHKNVLRGIHGDRRTWKLVTCLFGSVYAVIVNNDETSDQFKEWESFLLSDENNLQLLIPPRFGNSYLTLSEVSLYHYKQTTYYDRASQFTLAWDDPTLGISWPVENPVLSERDRLVK